MFRLTKPTAPRYSDWEPITQLALAETVKVLDAGRIDPADAYDVACAIAARAQRRTVRQSSLDRVSGRNLVGRYVWDKLGKQAFARLILGCSTQQDWDALRGNREKDSDAQQQIDVGTYASIRDSGDMLRAEPHQAAAAAKRLQDELKAADAAEEAHEAAKERGDDKKPSNGCSWTQELHGEHDFQAGPVVDHPEIRAFADRLRGRAKRTVKRDDEGSLVRGRSIAQWAAGAYRTPLGTQQPAKAPLAVSILIDVSSSTERIKGDIWDAATALAQAVCDAGHKVGIDAWGSRTAKTPKPLVAWGEPIKNFRPLDLDPNTMLRHSALPLMGRLQASAPVGYQQVCIVITDGATQEGDRADFLRLAKVPSIYWVIAPTTMEAHDLLPRDGEDGWVAKVACGADGAIDVALGDTMLGCLIDA
jgi:hypothetical protein